MSGLRLTQAEKSENKLYKSVLGSDLIYDPEYSEAVKESLAAAAARAGAGRRRIARFLKLGEGLTIIDIINLAHKQDLGYTWFCVGQRGSGKTTLAALLLYAIYGSWEACVKYLVYDLEELDLIKEACAESGVKAPLVVFDDAAMHLNNRRSWDPDIREFVRSYATMREYVNTVIFVTHDIEAVDSALRRDVNGILFPLNIMDVMPSPTSMGGRRIALFSLIKSVPDLRDPLRSFRYRIPIHSLENPIYFHELPPNVKAMLVEKKKASTMRIDIARTEMAIRDPEILRQLDMGMYKHHKALLRVLYAMERDGFVEKLKARNPREMRSGPRPIEILQYIKENADVLGEDAEALKGATEQMIKRYLAQLSGTVKPMVLGNPLSGYRLTIPGRAYIEHMEHLREEAEGGL